MGKRSDFLKPCSRASKLDQKPGPNFIGSNTALPDGRELASAEMVASPCSLHWLTSASRAGLSATPYTLTFLATPAAYSSPGRPHTSTPLPQFPLLSACNVVPGLFSLLELTCLQNLSDTCCSCLPALAGCIPPPHSSVAQLSPSKVWLSRACIWLQPIRQVL